MGTLNPFGKPPSFLKLLFTDFSEKLLIPPTFVRAYGETLGERCTLRPTHTRIPWSVTTKKVENRLYFEEGWKEFAKHHSLEFAYLLSFLYNPRVSEFDVVIFDKSSCSMDSLVIPPTVESILPDQQMKVDPIVAADELMSTSKFPSFKKVIRPVYARSNAYLSIPPDFARDHWKDSTRNVKIELSDKTWIVKFSGENYHKATFSSGWSALVMENSLEVGDVCVFELINTESDTLKLSIFKPTSGIQDENRIPHVKLRSSSSRLTAESTEPSTLIAESKEPSSKALVKANKYKSRSKYLSYAIVMRPSYVKKRYMHVSPSFLKKNPMKLGENEVKLQCLGKEWDLVFKITGHIGRINAGWTAFVKENSIQTGDVCVFELINRKNCVIRVSIFK